MPTLGYLIIVQRPTVDVGLDTERTVIEDYRVALAFTPDLKKVVVR